MGRLKKPAALARRDGDRKCRINEEEPKSPEGLGEPPEWLEGFALEGWATLLREVGPMKVATVADRQLAMLFCEAYADYREAKKIVAAEGMMIQQVSESRSLSGGSKSSVSYKANPLLPTMRAARDQMAKCLANLGMSPTSRASLRMEAQGETDELIEFQNGQK